MCSVTARVASVGGQVCVFYVYLTCATAPFRDGFVVIKILSVVSLQIFVQCLSIMFVTTP